MIPEIQFKGNANQMFLARGGEMGELMRSTDWELTPLGPAKSWPAQLKQLIAIMLNTPSPMLICWGPEYTQFYNDSYRPILGTNKHPLAMGIPVYETYPEVWETLEPLFLRVMAGESLAFHDYKLQLNRSGFLEDVFFDFSHSPILDESGKIQGVLVLCTETTERKRANEQLELSLQNQRHLIKTIQDSENNLKNIIVQAPVAMAIFNGPDFVIEVYNDRVLEFWGRTADEVKGKPLFEALPEASGQGFEELLTNVYVTGERFVAEELPVKLVRNEIFATAWINFIYDPVRDSKGKITGIMVVCHEVTDQVNDRLRLKESEQNLQMLADNISQLTWMTDETGYIFWYNKRWYDYTGTTLEDMQGWGWQKIHHPDHVADVTERWKGHIASTEVFEDTFPLRSKSGEYRWFLTRAVPLKDEHGKVMRWFGTNTDVTQQREIAQQKDDFITIASHELKTPVTSLKISLQLLDNMKFDPSPILPNLINHSNKSVDKISNLIDDLLDASRLNESQLHIRKTNFVLAELLEGFCNYIRAAGKHNLILNGDKELRVVADHHRIEQVIVNFVNNAVKYAPESKNIYLSIEALPGFAKVVVRDEGMGIAAEKIPHIFSKYYRVENKGDQYSGLGLGLYISAEIIKRHGGEIGVVSEPGKGSSFWFTLPLETS